VLHAAKTSVFSSLYLSVLQLRELAALNGTLKDEQYCFICGESGVCRVYVGGVGANTCSVAGCTF